MKIVFGYRALQERMGRVLCVLVGLTAALLLGIALRGALRPSDPADAAIYLRLADEQGFKRAAALNPQSSAAWMGLGLIEENRGNAGQAQRDLSRAVALDRGYLPLWTLANFHLRHADARAWPLLSDALGVAVKGNQQTAALFETCWQFRPEPDFLLRKVVGRSPEALRAYLTYLLEANRADQLLAPAQLLAETHGKQDEQLLLRASDTMLASGDAAGARQIWKYVEPDYLPGELLVNTEFKLPRQLAFDWRYNSIPESRITFGGLAQFDFSGKQPDPLELLFETVLLKSGTYLLTWDARQTAAQSQAGLFWQVTETHSGAQLFHHGVSSTVDWKPESAQFQLQSSALVRLALHTARPFGSTRFEGTVWLRHPSLKLK